MSDVLIKLDNVSKKFCYDLKKSLWYGVKDIVSEIAGRSDSETELRTSEFWSVKDISFELKRGDCLGLVGTNGAGKSTLLKMINGLIKPDRGSIEVRGRVGALIELGAGFNPILTGRENVYINGAILGFTREEIDQKFPQIVEFAELGAFIDTPVQNYSSGMKVRLGFSVAAQMEPDVLLIDEVLAVGDIGFRVKCLNRITELITDSVVIFVSHAMPSVSRICTHGMLLRKGLNVLYSSEVAKVIDSYYRDFSTGESRISGSGEIELLSLSVNDKPNEKKVIIPFGGNLKVCMKLKVNTACPTIRSRLQIWNQDQRPVTDVFNEDFLPFEWNNDSDVVSITTHIPELRLTSGNHFLTFGIFDSEKMQVLLTVENAVTFVMSHHYTSGCDDILAANWKRE